MKNITLSADEKLIEQARQVASQHRTTLNQAFRDWLSEYVKNQPNVSHFQLVMERLRYADAGNGFSRDEMNEM